MLPTHGKLDSGVGSFIFFIKNTYKNRKIIKKATCSKEMYVDIQRSFMIDFKYIVSAYNLIQLIK